MAGDALYDSIGRGYTATRRPDPRVGGAILDALGDARTVVNVGAGSGSYEPADRRVIAVEPSAAMVAQRSPHAAPAVRGAAEDLPFRDGAFEAALAILTLHHWSDWRRGVRELGRVSRRRVVLLTWEAGGADRFWLVDYFPQILALDELRFPPASRLAAELGGTARVHPVAIPRDCQDGFLAAYWARPDAYLDPRCRAGISFFAEIDAAEVKRGVERLERDLNSGDWHARLGPLISRSELDLGYRLVVCEKPPS